MDESKDIEWNWLGPVLILLLGLGFFTSSISHQFVYDDLFTVIRNKSLDSVFPLTKFFTDASTVAEPSSGITKDVYRPLSTMTLAISKAASGLNPGAFRSVSILIHIFNAIVLWWILRIRLNPGLSLFGALLFLIHPIQLESVVWITQRSVLICALGVLLSFYFWELSYEKPRLVWVSLGFFVLALFGKETAIGLPLILWMSSKLKGNIRKGPLIISLSILAGYILIRANVLGHWGQSVDPSRSVGETVLYGIHAVPLYVRNLVWPMHLNVSYKWPLSVGWTSITLWIGIIVLLVLLALFWSSAREKMPWCIGMLFMLVFWFPHFGLRPMITYAADRFMYLPMAGLAMAVAWGFQKNRYPALLLIPLLLAAGLWVKRLPDWENERTLWSASVRDDDSNAFAHAALAQTHFFASEWEMAKKEYLIAVRRGLTFNLAASVVKALVIVHERLGDDKGADEWKEKLKTIPQ